MPGNESNAAYDILRELRRVIRGISLQSRQLAKESGLTFPQLACLRAIFVAPEQELTIAALAQAVQLSPATISGIVDRLERDGLVQRERWATDRRKVSARLTQAGLQKLENSPQPIQEQFLQRLRALTDAERQQLMNSLGLLVSLLGAEHVDASPILMTEDVGNS